MNTATNQGLIEDLRLVDLPAWWQNPWTWVLMIALALVAIYLVRRWRKAAPIKLKLPKPEPPGPPAHVTALARLEELRKRHANLTAYQVALECSDILRRFIEARYRSPIRYQTTREFLGAALVNPEFSADARGQLGEFLEFFDDIKFAQQTAPAEQTARAIDDAAAFVGMCSPGGTG